MAASVELLARKSAACARRCAQLGGVRLASSEAGASAAAASVAAPAAAAVAVAARPNWLELDCGDVPVHPCEQDAEVSEMLRGGHAMQIASAKMLDAKVGGAASYSSAHVAKLKELQATENKAVERIEQAVRTEGFRFRPSLLIPAVSLSSTALGGVLGALGDNVSTSYVTGVKMAVSDYYNDQVRELYERKPELVELKELFKVARNEEQEFVDEHTPDILDPNKGEPDAVANFAKMSCKVLLQAAKVL